MEIKPSLNLPWITQNRAVAVKDTGLKLSIWIHLFVGRTLSGRTARVLTHAHFQCHRSQEYNYNNNKATVMMMTMTTTTMIMTERLGERRGGGGGGASGV